MNKYEQAAEIRCRCVIEKHGGDLPMAMFELLQRRNELIVRKRTSHDVKVLKYAGNEIHHINNILFGYHGVNYSKRFLPLDM